MKKIMVMMLAFCLTIALCACGQTTVPAAESSQTTEEEDKNLTPLELEYLVELVYDDLEENGIPFGIPKDLKKSLLDENNVCTISFTVLGEDAFYKLNGLTGDIVEKNLPDVELDFRDYLTDASAICLKYIDYKSGNLDHFTGKQTTQDDGVIVQTYSFDCNGKRYSFEVSFLSGYDVYTEDILKISSSAGKSLVEGKNREEMIPLDSAYLTEVVNSDMIASGVTAGIAAAEGLGFDSQDADGNVKVHFKIQNIDCWYLLDAFTGDIVDKELSQKAIDAARDYYSEAFSKAMTELEIQGQPENISMSRADSDNGEFTITVQFDFNGDHYSYDAVFEANAATEEENNDAIIAEAKDAIITVKGECTDPSFEIKKSGKLTFVKADFSVGSEKVTVAYVPEEKAIVEDVTVA